MFKVLSKLDLNGPIQWSKLSQIIGKGGLNCSKIFEKIPIDSKLSKTGENHPSGFKWDEYS